MAAEDYIAGPDEFLDAVYDAVAERELLEELGVSARLTFINHFPPESGVHYEQIRLYSGVSDGPFSLQEEEVSEIKAVTHKEYDMMLATKQPLTDALKRFVQWSRDHHIWVESP